MQKRASQIAQIATIHERVCVVFTGMLHVTRQRVEDKFIDGRTERKKEGENMFSKEVAKTKDIIEGSIEYSYPTEQEMQEAAKLALTPEEYETWASDREYMQARDRRWL